MITFHLDLEVFKETLAEDLTKAIRRARQILT